MIRICNVEVLRNHRARYGGSKVRTIEKHGSSIFDDVQQNKTIRSQFNFCSTVRSRGCRPVAHQRGIAPVLRPSVQCMFSCMLGTSAQWMMFVDARICKSQSVARKPPQRLPLSTPPPKSMNPMSMRTTQVGSCCWVGVACGSSCS